MKYEIKHDAEHSLSILKNKRRNKSDLTRKIIDIINNELKDDNSYILIKLDKSDIAFDYKLRYILRQYKKDFNKNVIGFKDGNYYIIYQAKDNGGKKDK